MISGKFIKSSFIYSVIGSLPMVSGIILLPFYTNYLHTSDFGILAIYITLSLLIQIIVNFGLDSFIGIHYFDVKDNETKLKEYLSTVTTLLLFIGTFFLVLFYMCGDWFFTLLFKNSGVYFFPYGFMSVLTAVCNSFFKTYTNLLITQQRPEQFLLMNLIYFVLSLVISIAGLQLFPFTLQGPMWGRLLSSLIMFLIMLYLSWRSYGIGFNRKILYEILLFSSPLILYHFTLWGNNYITHYILNTTIDSTAVGIYDFALKCAMMLDFLQIGLISAIQPKVFALWKKQDTKTSSPDINKYYSGFTAVFLFFIPLIVIFLPILIPLVVNNSDYYYSFTFIGVLCVSYVTRGLFNMFQAPLLFQKKTASLPKIMAVSVAIQIILTIILVNYYSIMGAVWALFFIRIIQPLLYYFESKKFFNFQFNKNKMVLLPLVYVVLTVVSSFIINPNNCMVIYITHALIIWTLLIIIYKNELRFLYQKFISKTAN